MSSGKIGKGHTWLKTVIKGERTRLGWGEAKSREEGGARGYIDYIQHHGVQLGLPELTFGPRRGMDLDAGQRYVRHPRVIDTAPRPLPIGAVAGVWPQQDIWQQGRVLAVPGYGPYIGPTGRSAPGVTFLIQDYAGQLAKSQVG